MESELIAWIISIALIILGYLVWLLKYVVLGGCIIICMVFILHLCGIDVISTIGGFINAE